MKHHTYRLLGWVFVLASGFVYTLERLRSAIVYVGVNVSENSYISSPSPPFLFENAYVFLFLFISVWFFYKARKINPTNTD